MKELNEIVAENIIRLRTENKLTQAELAEKLNYTDKSISKWERGDSLPTLEVMIKLSEIFNVSLDYLVSEYNDDDRDEIFIPKENTSNKLTITLLADMLVWLIAVVLYVYFNFAFKADGWLIFIWAIPISTLVLFIFNAIWGKRKVGFVLLSAFVWTLLAALYLQFLAANIWLIFLVGIPVQIAIILWSRLKKRPKKPTRKKIKNEEQ